MFKQLQDAVSILEVSEKKDLAQVLNQALLSEIDINLLFRRLNTPADSEESVGIFNQALRRRQTLKLSFDQVQKAMSWVRRRWKTPKGKLVKNTPFTKEEELILMSATTVVLSGAFLYGSERTHYYTPEYSIISPSGTLKYCVLNGNINIIG